ncbi:MAG TPA: helix-turn-helix transcriptional regulator [Candidatus Scybalomonas excrementigallinarum]|nr:helix-turn-helix transcriptional regulator [Candidatus Scybalomonas excrementigallinarum]
MEKPKDHLGHEFNNKQEMCDYWNVKLVTFYKRLEQGKSLQEALEGSYVLDHIGQKFSSEFKMCEYWDVNYWNYIYRRSQGCSIEESLSPERKIDKRTIEMEKKSNNKVKELRKRKEWTQKELAEKAGISIRVLQRIEIGEVHVEEVKVRTIKALADALCVKIEDLIE